MAHVLLTAFEPYGPYPLNASWLTLVELARGLPLQPQVTTRRYPVDFVEARRLLAADLETGYDFALHLGQAPGQAAIHLEEIAINVGFESVGAPAGNGRLSETGPVAFRSQLPLERFAGRLRTEGIPARVSHHAGTYLCNAILYWSHELARQLGRPTRSTFVHLPLDVSQVIDGDEQPCLPVSTSAAAVRLLLEELLLLETDATEWA